MLTLEEALVDRERQESEFKTSTAETNEAAQTLVGFANSRGGQVFFGVTDAGRPVGIEYSDKVQKSLTAKLDMLIYPSLPLEFDTFPSESPEKRVVRVWTPADRPPIVGGYLYSKDRLTLDSRVQVARAQAYRRVGSRTQKIDFMWLRGVLASDPLVIIDGGDNSQVQADHVILRWVVWHVSGGVALQLNVSTDPPLGATVGPIKDLPGAGRNQVAGALGLSVAALRSCRLEDTPSGPVGILWLVVTYRDEWGCEWESRRQVPFQLLPSTQFDIVGKEPVVIPKVQTWSTPEFRRRIVTLPPKRLAWPA